MARTYARLLSSIWSDPDFVAMPERPQRLYLALISQPDLSPCGVLPYKPAFWATWATDSTPNGLGKAATMLADQRFIVVDRVTAEVLIRSFMRRETLQSPNLFKAACRAFGAIHSPTVRDAVREGLPEPLREGFPEAFLDRHPKGLGELLREGIREGLLDHSRRAESGERNPESGASTYSGDGTTRARAKRTHPGTPEHPGDAMARAAHIARTRDRSCPTCAGTHIVLDPDTDEAHPCTTCEGEP